MADSCLSILNMMADAVEYSKSLENANSILASEITERKQAQEKLIKSEKNLSESERIGKTGSWDMMLQRIRQTGQKTCSGYSTLIPGHRQN